MSNEVTHARRLPLKREIEHRQAAQDAARAVGDWHGQRAQGRVSTGRCSSLLAPFLIPVIACKIS
jgi:hypothetical protein